MEPADRRVNPQVRDEARKELARRELARRRLLPMVLRFENEYVVEPVHRVICVALERFLERIARQESPRLVIEIQPRVGKSTLVSRYLPAFALGHHPMWEIVVASYALDLPVEHSRFTRSLITDERYTTLFPHVRLSPDTKGAEFWRITAGGSYRAVGVGGGLTGQGAHCLESSTRVVWREGAHVFQGTVAELYNRVKSTSCFALCYYNNTLAWKEIRDGLRIATTDSIELGFRGGDFIKVTPDHPVCIGYNRDARPVYVKARELRPGDGCVAFENPWTPGVSEVRRVRGVVHSQSCPDAESIGQTGSLLREMRGEAAFPGPAGKTGLPSVRGGVLDCTGVIGPGQREILLEGVLHEVVGSQKEAGEGPLFVEPGYADVLPLWQAVYSQEIPCVLATDQESVLFEGMLLRKPERPVYREYGVLNTPYAILLPRVQAGQAADYACGLRDMRSSGEGPAPYRREQREQFAGQFATLMSVVPHKNPHPEIFYDFDVADGHSLMVIGPKTNLLYQHLNCLIVDDPHRDAESADSKVQRDAVHAWFSSVAYTRLAPGGGCVLMMTRWHDDDLAGRVQREAQEREKELRVAMDEAGDEREYQAAKAELEAIDRWEVLSFESILEEAEEEYIAENGKIYRRQEGEPPAPEGYKLLRRRGESISPTRFPVRRLLRIKGAIQPRHWSALYQQKPVPDTGLYFVKDNFRVREYRIPWERWPVVIAWDPAVTEGQRSDYTVGAVGVLDPQRNLHVLDIIRGRFLTERTVALILDVWLKYKTPVTTPLVGFEDGVIKQAIWPFLKQEMDKRRVYPPFRDDLKPISDKEARARPLQGMMQAGRVIFPANAPWLDTVKQEMLRFPSGIHDDIVDALAWLARMALDLSPPRDKAARKPMKSWKDKLSRYVEGRSRGDPMAA